MEDTTIKLVKKHVQIACQYVRLASALLETEEFIDAEAAITRAGSELGEIRGIILDAAGQGRLPLSVREGGEEV